MRRILNLVLFGLLLLPVVVQAKHKNFTVSGLTCKVPCLSYPKIL